MFDFLIVKPKMKVMKKTRKKNLLKIEKVTELTQKQMRDVFGGKVSPLTTSTIGMTYVPREDLTVKTMA